MTELGRSSFVGCDLVRRVGLRPKDQELFVSEKVVAMQVVVIALFGAMLGVALWAWVAAPQTARFPVRVGNPPGFDGTVGKRTDLVMWVALELFRWLVHSQRMRTPS